MRRTSSCCHWIGSQWSDAAGVTERRVGRYGWPRLLPRQRPVQIPAGLPDPGSARCPDRWWHPGNSQQRRWFPVRKWMPESGMCWNPGLPWNRCGHPGCFLWKLRCFPGRLSQRSFCSVNNAACCCCGLCIRKSAGYRSGHHHAGH